MMVIVFHWQRSYSQKAQRRAFLEGREPTVDDMIADGNGEPQYRFSAFAVPPGTEAERRPLLRLVEGAGFRKDKASTTWVALHEGEASTVALKAALEAARIRAFHYHDVPLAFIIEVNSDGLL